MTEITAVKTINDKSQYNHINYTQLILYETSRVVCACERTRRVFEQCRGCVRSHRFDELSVESTIALQQREIVECSGKWSTTHALDSFQLIISIGHI